ncbi:glycosyltransferase [Kineococcus sp. SYSU DK002]|uniref:glycosyltransferase n=1 Tax=Kineococcus sp. SYSU DK002 TaxID=3383123 RepID=UPI003D7DFC32
MRDHLLSLQRWRPTALTSWRQEDPLEVPGVPVVEAREHPLVARVRDRLPGRLVPEPLERQENQLRSALRRLRPDVLHAHFGTDAAVVARAARDLGIPLVVTWHGYDATLYDEALEKSPAGRLLLARRSELLAGSATIAVSGFIAAELARRGADAASTTVIPCGVDTERVVWTPPPADGGLLFVGRLVEKKGLGDLLGALAGLAAPPPLTVIGDGPLRGPLEERARRSGADVRFLGVRTSEEVRMAMREAQAVVIPSRRAANGDCEGLPVVSLEAAASGRPVVAYAHSGLVESVLDGSTGLLAQEGDVAGLAGALEKLTADADLRAGFGLAARELAVRSFDIRVTTARIEAVYDRARAARA